MADASPPIEVSGELLTIWPRFVKVDTDLWINPDHVVSVSPTTGHGTAIVIQTESRSFRVAGRIEDVIAALQNPDD
jgi:hypothetical protein